jgi:hypothetical protein
MNWFKSLWGGAANPGRSDNETIQQRIRRHVERRGGTPAVWFAPDQFCSYSQMNENATIKRFFISRIRARSAAGLLCRALP